MELLAKKYVYTGKDGKEHTGHNFYLSLDNGRKISIKPSFYEDTAKLLILSKEID